MGRPLARDGARVIFPIIAVGLAVWTANLTLGSAASAGAAVTTAQFNGVACYSFNACVGVGYWRPAERAAQEQFAAAWDGRGWSLLATPAGHAPGYLFSADCVAALCVLVGEWTNPSGRFVPLAEVWDKAGAVRDMAAPVPTTSAGAALDSVSCLSKTYCLAVGWQVASGRIRPLAMTFDGSSWSVIPAPAPNSPVARLTSVACVPKRFMADFWCQAVGWYRTPSRRTVPLALSWDGTAWSPAQVENPHGNRSSNQLRSVSCREILCLAVGVAADPNHPGILSERLVSRTGGAPKTGNHVWQADAQVPAPPGAGKIMLNSVSCRFPNACKGAGAYYDRTTRRWRTLIEHWQGGWHLNTNALCFHRCTASVPGTPYPTNVLSSVSCVTYNSCMAVGDSIGRKGPVLVTAPLALWLQHTAGFKWVLTPAPTLH